MAMTFGQKKVGLTFDPSGDPNVQQLNELYAQVIDLIVQIRDDQSAAGLGGQDRGRLFSIAITEAEGAQMWAAKAVTWQD